MLIPIPFAAWHALAWFAEMLPNPPVTRNQVELMQVDNVSSPDMPGSKELEISLHSVEEILQEILCDHWSKSFFGYKHPLGLIEGATENTAVVQALIGNLIERGLDPKVCRLFIIDGAKALSKVIRSTFGRHTPIQCCQVHKAHNVIERLPKPPGHGHVGVRNPRTVPLEIFSKSSVLPKIPSMNSRSSLFRLPSIS
jgi:hypothetical protein